MKNISIKKMSRISPLHLPFHRLSIDTPIVFTESGRNRKVFAIGFEVAL